jgi:general stress protein CsbA
LLGPGTKEARRTVGRTLLITVELIAASIWIGSLLCLALVARVAAKVLDPPARVALFRGIGQLYRVVGTSALVASIAAGAALAGSPSEWSVTIDVVAVLAGVLVVLTAVGMAQARRMTVVRRHAIVLPDDETAVVAVRRGAATAGVLRGLMATVTLAIVVLVASELAA